MPYKSLIENRGRLWNESTLQPELKATAETWADREVDRLFWDWDRSDWTTTVPWEIADVAELLGAGHYLELAFTSPSSMPVDQKTTGRMLKEEGWALADRIKLDGGPLYSDGTYRVGPIKDEDRDLFVEIEPV